MLYFGVVNIFLVLCKVKTTYLWLVVESVYEFTFQQWKFTQIPFISVAVKINDYFSIVFSAEIPFIYRTFHV